MGEEVKVLVFTRTPSSFARLGSHGGKKALEVEVLPVAGVRDALRSSAEESLVYLDLHGLGEKERQKTLSLVTKHPDILFGIIDAGGAVEDVAALFHAGAVDYIGKKLGAGALTAKRVAKVAEYARSVDQASDALDLSEDMPEPMSASASDAWAEIVPGREYRFGFLYIEADDAEELKKRHEPENLASAMETFRGFIDRMVTQHGGRLWLWSRFGGLALFPLRGGTCLAPQCGLRILLSRIFYDVEESLLPGRLSFRMALSIGSTVYRKSNTGGIVSDGINSIFHLGQRFTRPGQFLLTEEACEMSPPPLRGHFLPAGTYEGRRIMRMLRPFPSPGSRESDPACES
jgi:hypothetical protein